MAAFAEIASGDLREAHATRGQARRVVAQWVGQR